jgi:alkanesulfonate monooxygenase SsuD/methylene tetrahydromethanopterin reductase-like flavin-dependent oxidoreductase (luciferase family)
MIERAKAARQADLDSLFVGDHHVTSQPYYQNSVILGRMLAQWHTKPAGALYLLPLWNPVLLAEQIGTLAAIMPGRFVLQCALGGDRRQSEGMGVDMRLRVPMFEASLSIMRALWSGETVTHERFWNIVDARIAPIPQQQVEVWIGSSAPPAIERTARLADGWLAAPGIGLKEAREQLNRYRQACAEHSRTPSATAIRRDVFVGTTSQAARQLKQGYLDKGYRGFPEEALLCGTVNEVVDELAGFAEAGFTDVIVRNISSDQADSLATIDALHEVKVQLESI